MVSNSYVAKRFAQGSVKLKGNHMFIDGNVVYSWGYHYPIAIRLTNDVALLNIDKCSISTSRHSREVIWKLMEYRFIIIEADTKFMDDVIQHNQAYLRRNVSHSTIDKCLENIKIILKDNGIKRAPIKRWKDMIDEWKLVRLV